MAINLDIVKLLKKESCNGVKLIFTFFLKKKRLLKYFIIESE